MDLNKPLLDKIAEMIYDYVIHSEQLNVPIMNIQAFYLDETKVAVTYTSQLNAYDFMVISGKIDSLDAYINDEPCLCIEEKYITEQVNNLLK